MKELLGFKLYKRYEDTFIQALILIGILLIGFVFISSSEAKQTIVLLMGVLIGFIFLKILKR